MVHQVFDCARIDGSAAEEGVMTAPNPAVDAKPGDRFTDPDGGTWVRMAPLSRAPWLEIAEWKVLCWHSWEEAEAAGLVPLVAETAPVPLDPGKSAVADADRGEDAKQFLAVWTGGKHLSDEHREDFIAGWTGWHRGADFQRECTERDAKAAIDAYVSALAVERAELTAALADARKAES